MRRHFEAGHIVVTNPPFSLFREYIAQLIEHDKKFIVIGNQNAISYAEIFPLIKSNQLWLGINPGGRDMYFDIPQNHVQSLKDNYDEGSAYVYVDGQIKRRLGNAAWFTNLEYSDRRDKKLELTKKYKAESYPHYDNYDAIEVSAVSNIPKDYEGMMGVPITFLEKYSPDQFEIVGMDRPLIKELTGRQKRFVLAGRECYARIVIKNKNPEKPGTLN